MGERETGTEREKHGGRGRDRNREGERDWSDRQAESAGVLKAFLIQSACVIKIYIYIHMERDIFAFIYLNEPYNY